jgi:hypothetical protein
MEAVIEVTGDRYLDNTYNAIMFVVDPPDRDRYSIVNVHFKDIKVDGTGTSVLSARVAGSASFQNVVARNVGAAGINTCGPFKSGDPGACFGVLDLGGNGGGWMDDSIHEDRPTVAPPRAPSAW